MTSANRSPVAALHLAYVANEIARIILRLRKEPGVPSANGIYAAVPMIATFSSKFYPIHEDENGQPIWLNGHGHGINRFAYERIENESSTALYFMQLIAPADLKAALRAVAKENVSSGDLYFPEDTGFEDIDSRSTFDILPHEGMQDAYGMLGTWVASRALYTGLRLHAALRGATRAALSLLPSRTAMGWNDFQAMMELSVTCKDSDEGGDAYSIDHLEDLDLLDFTRQIDRLELEVIEFSKVEPIHRAADAWWRWAKALDVSHLMQDGLERERLRALENVRTQQDSLPRIAAAAKRLNAG